MKKIMIILFSVLIVSCSENTQNKKNENDRISEKIEKQQNNNKTEDLKLLTYSNLVDKKTQEELKNELLKAGIQHNDIENFLESVNYFNSEIDNESLVKEGFITSDSLNPDYNIEVIQNKWEEKNSLFPGYNCRITSFGLMKDYISLGNPEINDTSQLFIDEEALNSTPLKKFNENERKIFNSFFSIIKTEKTKDIDKHIIKVKEDWRKKNITFKKNDKLSLISVFFHSLITPEENFLFIGHAGVLINSDNGKLIFIEKLSFQEPYQVLKFDNRTQLNDYLMNKYDVEWGQETASPFIMENDELMDGYRLNPNKGKK
ncbi:DUF4300 family protein [Leptotrichia sp. OH3620_COT-345]|uniref:DUF4300 family protein n=1 Tax=Leptotrichia sp. OH3620_COT-345 TaxID=2491048 RepID=UPI000F64AD92|nr:DUF4300 family protein [Leptotrichia sp. OH3620_COT-345]RRD39064.1 DUF4300 family protein [Leptotrichia sp. OH3620_COT-345]